MSSVLASLNSGRYSPKATAKSVAGLGGLEFTVAHNRAKSGFFVREPLAHLNYGGLGGEAFGLAGFYCDRSANAIQVTTIALGGVSGGELSKLTVEAVIMATFPAQIAPKIIIADGRAVTTSIAIAEYFTKRHDDVLKKIRTLECSPEFTARNFAVSEYTDATGRKLPCYQITRDGFAFLAMGFTGKRAARFKEDYINAFNSMEHALHRVPCVMNIQAISYHTQVIAAAWRERLYPMLVDVKSPLAHELNDHICDAAFVAGLLCSSLANAKRGQE
ncbi:peptidase [Martelella alba]|uniref:Peptidase n=2 Tax=Martelella alba TaxID=2590451 RepID=A0ABY2SDW1_9HYPH|nr:peptidase [Martelella alba]